MKTFSGLIYLVTEGFYCSTRGPRHSGDKLSDIDNRMISKSKMPAPDSWPIFSQKNGHLVGIQQSEE